MAKVALLIGVSEYEPGFNRLPAAVKDVEAMQRVLVHQEMGGFAEADITVLKNPQRQEMEDAIYRLFANRQKDDLLLFYFSGHGIKDESGRLYLSTCATRKENGRLVRPSAVNARFLHDSINESRSQRQVLILDCCFSGAIAQGLTVKDDGSVNVREQLGGKGRAILTASTSTQYSFEQEGSELSVYTRYLVEGIEKGAADLDEDGWISVNELHDYASTKVTEAAPAMTPKFYPVEEGYRILLAKSPKDDPKLKYRKEVEKLAKRGEGNFSVFARNLLNSKRDEWRISAEEARVIEDDVLQPFREYQRKLQKYEQDLIKAVEAEYPFSESTEADLKDYQEYLGLRDEDIAAIEARVIAPKQAEYELRIKQAEQQRTSPPAPLHPSRSPVKENSSLSSPRVGGIEGGGERTEDEAFDLREGSNTPPFPSREGGLGGLGLPSPEINPLSRIKTQPFEFEVATLCVVRKSGWFGGEKVTHEINRSRGQAEFFTETLGNGVMLEMVAIPDGKFLMGSPEDELERFDRESPQHTVTIQPLFMGKFPVTQAQWRIVASFPKVNIDLDPDPSHFKGENRPVEQVSWYDAVEFCDRLSRETERQYRLPSEAEWEYACRARTTTPFHFGETITADLANYCGGDRTIEGTLYKGSYGDSPKGIYREQTTEVGSFSANAFGLYDMHGNVWEWCADHWHNNYDGAPTDGSAWLAGSDNDDRMLRGGSWFYNPRNCRSASRFRFTPDFRDFTLGFRVVVSPARTP